MDFDYKLHAQIGIKSDTVPSLRLWYLCRAYDQKGCGSVTVPLTLVQEAIECSRTTLWRYLKDTKVIRSYRINKGIVTIYYRSLINVCKDLGIEQLGGIGKVDTVHDLYENSILITALQMQHTSELIAKKENKNSSLTFKGKKISPDEERQRYSFHNTVLKYFDSDGNSLTSHMCRGAMVGTSSKNETKLLGVVRVFETNKGITNLILSSRVLPYGASYKGIARRLGITPKAVGHYLRKASRVRIILRPSQHMLSKTAFLATEDLCGENPTSGYYKDHKGRDMKYHTNLYYPAIPLCYQTQLRKKLIKGRFKVLMGML